MVKRFLLVMLAVLSFVAASAADIYGISADGSREVFKICDIESIKLEAKGDGEQGFHTIVFDKSLAGGVAMTASVRKAIMVYPNPVSEYITISGADEMDEVIVSNMMGEVVIRTKGSRVDVSNLTQGNYILSINGKAVKFIKK